MDAQSDFRRFCSSSLFFFVLFVVIFTVFGLMRTLYFLIVSCKLAIIELS